MTTKETKTKPFEKIFCGPYTAIDCLDILVDSAYMASHRGVTATSTDAEVAESLGLETDDQDLPQLGNSIRRYLAQDPFR